MAITLQKLGPLFLVFDHQNDARWIPVFIRDMEGPPYTIQTEFKEGHWTKTQSNLRSSSIPIDQAHEHANKRDKGVGGA